MNRRTRVGGIPCSVYTGELPVALEVGPALPIEIPVVMEILEPEIFGVFP
jgi:hypothetical protein